MLAISSQWFLFSLTKFWAQRFWNRLLIRFSTCLLFRLWIFPCGYRVSCSELVGSSLCFCAKYHTVTPHWVASSWYRIEFPPFFHLTHCTRCPYMNGKYTLNSISNSVCTATWLVTTTPSANCNYFACFQIPYYRWAARCAHCWRNIWHNWKKNATRVLRTHIWLVNMHWTCHQLQLSSVLRMVQKKNLRIASESKRVRVCSGVC